MAQRNKPVAAIIVGILNILVALPCMCCLGANAVTLLVMSGGGAGGAQAKPAANDPFGQAMAQGREQIEFIAKESPGYKAEQIFYNVVAVLCSITLIVAAIGLFIGKPFGRLLTIATCAVMLVAVLVNTAYTAVFIMPATKKFQEQQFKAKNLAPPPKGLFDVSGAVGIIFALLIGAGYPALAIGLLMTGPVRAYYSGSGGGRARRRDDYDDDDYDRRRDDEDDYDDRRRDEYDR